MGSDRLRNIHTDLKLPCHLKSSAFFSGPVTGGQLTSGEPKILDVQKAAELRFVAEGGEVTFDSSVTSMELSKTSKPHTFPRPRSLFSFGSTDCVLYPTI